MYKANVAGCTKKQDCTEGLSGLIARVLELPRERPHLQTGDRGIGNFRLLNGSAIEACPALFPCNNALPARNRLGVAQDTCLQESRPLARARRKELSLGDLAARAQQQQQRNNSRNS